MISSFAGRGTPLAQADIDHAVAILGGNPALLWSLVAVETSGFGFLPDRRPQILFERHVFHRLTNGRFSRAYPDISNPVPGGYSGGAAEYDRLQRAMQLDEHNALQSASWGLGEVMGFNAASAGFATVEAMVTTMVAGEGAHLQALTAFIASNSALLAAYQATNWAKIAFFYNGSNYQQGQYDLRLEEHYNQFSAAPGNLPDMGLRTAQACLTYLGFGTNGVDGVLGPATRAAIRAYRQSRGLPPGTGIDPNLSQRLAADAQI
jgi:hypothetical protein